MEEFFNEKCPFFASMNYGKQLFFFLSITIILMIFSSGILCSIGALFECSENIHFLRFVQCVNSITLFLLPALLFSKWVTGNFWSYSSADTIPKKQMFLIVTGLSICILPVTAVLAYLNELIQLPEFLEKVEIWMKTMEEHAQHIILLMTETKTISVLLLNLLVMAVIPAICEEFFFRGALQPLLQQWSKKTHLAIWITAFIFSTIHLQFYGFIPRFLLGAYLGYLAVWGRSIWLPVFAHFLYNGMMILLDFWSIL
jgi:membrane protease YdiL (CAAX protease family)